MTFSSADLVVTSRKSGRIGSMNFFSIELCCDFNNFSGVDARLRITIPAAEERGELA
jgi:hypothetical protein